MNGIINVNKPKGITSFDVVFKIKKVAHTKKVGHTGTLDPEATGVLPICIGKATRFVDYLMKDYKIYRVHLKLGIETDTYDNTGKILNSNDVNISNDELIHAINNFKGKISQVPPMYSALKVDGQRLYSLARQGINIERKPREIEIFSIDIIDIKLPDVFFDVKCSKGTYIRSLCHDIGEILKVGGSMWNLERLSSGFFNINNSVNLEDLNEDNINKYIIPVDKALSNYPEVKIDMNFEKLLLNGVSLMDPRVTASISENILYRVYIGDKFIGLGEAGKNGFKLVKQYVEEHLL
ncbi:MAG: tRNA pseudouridine(55) synthase TruB [Solirubrobacterales bacterium]